MTQRHPLKSNDKIHSDNPFLSSLIDFAKKISEEFNKESDRGFTILATLWIEALLRSLVCDCLRIKPEKHDVKLATIIQHAYYLKLISRKMRNDLNTLRGIRNKLVHMDINSRQEVLICSWDNSKIQNKINQLISKFSNSIEQLPEVRNCFTKENKIKGDFQTVIILIMNELLVKNLEQFEPAKDEACYNVNCRHAVVDEIFKKTNKVIQQHYSRKEITHDPT